LVFSKAVYCSYVASSKVVEAMAMKAALSWIKDGWTDMGWSQIAWRWQTRLCKALGPGKLKPLFMIFCSQATTQIPLL